MWSSDGALEQLSSGVVAEVAICYDSNQLARQRVRLFLRLHPAACADQQRSRMTHRPIMRHTGHESARFGSVPLPPAFRLLGSSILYQDLHSLRVFLIRPAESISS